MADRSVKVIASANVQGLVNGMRTAKGAVEDFAKSGDRHFAKNRQQLDELAGSATKGGLALVGMAAFAGKAAMDWESAWAGVTKTVDGSASQMATLEGQLRDLAKTLPATHQEIAAVAEAAGQLGVAREDVAEFTRTMIDLGETTNLSSDEAATSIAQMMNVMQTAPGDVDNLASSLVALGNDGASTERDIVQMAQNLAGAGATVGLAETDVLGLANALASVGIEAEAGGSSVSKILIDMAKAAKTGSADLETWASTAGMATAEFGELVAQDPAKAFDAFTKGLGRINAEGGDVFTLLENLGQSDVRVTRALLGMANAGNLLSDSLALGASSWQENSALAEEAAKRYDTTSAQAQVAWNNIKDNAIDAGQAILPVISSVSDVVVKLADAFGSLPGPVKSSLGLLAGGTGGLLLAAAAFTKVYGAVQDTREAFKGLQGTSPRLASGLKSAAGAAGVVTGAMIAMNAAFEALDRDSAATVEDMTAAILDLSDGTASLNENLSNSRGLASITTGMSDLGAAAKEAHKGTEGFTSFMSGTVFSVFGTFSALNPYGDAMEDVEAYDQALTSLVNSGATEQAARGHEEFADAAREAGLKTKDIERLLPGYTAALKDVDNQSRIAAGGTKEFEAAQAQATEEHEKARDAARKQAGAFITLGGSLNDSKVSLRSWIDEMANQAKALEQFTANARRAGKKGLDEGLIASLREAGPEGAMRLQQLAGASEKEIARANKSWRRGQNAIEDYTNAVAGVPTSAATTLAVNGYARVVQVIRDVRGQLRGLDGTGATVWIREKRTGKDHGGGAQTSNADGGIHENGVKTFANGGFDEFGRPVQRVPQIRSGSQGTVMWGEPETGWEAYVSGKPSQKPRNRQILSEAAGRLGGSVQWFADGGFTEAVSARELTGLRIRVRDIQRALKETEKTRRGKRFALRGLDRLEARQELREARAELAEQNRIRSRIGKGKKYKTTGQYNRAMERAEEAREKATSGKENRQSVAGSFADGLDGDAFKSPASLERALSNMLRDSAEHTQLLSDLRKKGASPWLLEQLVKAGPSRATNRTARALLADADRLKRLNAMSSGIVTTANNYAALTTGAGFTQSFSGAAGFDYNALAKAMSQVQINAALSVDGRQAGVLVQAGQKQIGSNG